MLPNQIGALPAVQPTQESHGRRRVPDHHCRANSTSLSVDYNRRADGRFAIYALLFAFAPAFAGLAGNPEAAPIVRVLTTVILIDGVTAMRAGYLVRTFQHRRITTANPMGLAVQATVAITLAANGAGAMSFAAGQVSGAVVIGAFVLWSAHMPWRFGLDRAVARRLMHFGVPLAMALGLEAILMNADYVIAGRTLGAMALGLYMLGRRGRCAQHRRPRTGPPCRVRPARRHGRRRPCHLCPPGLPRRTAADIYRTRARAAARPAGAQPRDTRRRGRPHRRGRASAVTPATGRRRSAVSSPRAPRIIRDRVVHTDGRVAPSAPSSEPLGGLADELDPRPRFPSRGSSRGSDVCHEP
jgi:Polysaccharide biosynthesis protein